MKILLKLLLYLSGMCVCAIAYSKLDSMHITLKNIQKAAEDDKETPSALYYGSDNKTYNPLF